MSVSNQAWGNGKIGIFLVLVLFFIWIFAGGRPFYRYDARDIKTSVRDAGHDLKSTGRDVADSIRHTVQ